MPPEVGIERIVEEGGPLDDLVVVAGDLGEPLADRPQAGGLGRRPDLGGKVRPVDDAGAAIDEKTLDSTEATIRETIPMWTAGTLKAFTIERGTEERVGWDAWITVRWPSVAGPEGICGSADVGRPGGEIRLYYKSNCSCPSGPQVRPRTVRHEVGHAMGFWHTDSPTDLMAGIGVAGCDQRPSPRELAHAAIAYHRPVGNLDPDTDPDSVPSVSVSPVRDVP